MSDIDLSKKISVQRPFGSRGKDDHYAMIRQFESDRGRVINSAAIRRLQQKTQVFPLERNAAVRSRLTHSLEVQQVGRYIVKMITERLQGSAHPAVAEWQKYATPIESIVEMACLMHDIGNPPFGHFGENAINHWFRALLAPDYCENAEGEDLCKIEVLRLEKIVVGQSASDKKNNIKIEQRNDLRSQIRRDLCHFEGNAQAIRLLHHLQHLNLTYSQVACILKYTKPAYWHGDIPENKSYLMKKTGFYLTEKEFIGELRNVLDMSEYDRYPLTYIMEAADDISYCIADLEDAVEKGILTVEQLYGYLRDAWGANKTGDLFDKTVAKAYRQMEEGNSRRSDSDQFFIYFRANTISALVSHAAKRFIKHLSEIFTGEFNQALLEDQGEPFKLLKIFKDVALEYVFSHAEVELLELQGYRVISGLLDIYGQLLKIPEKEFLLLAENNRHRHYPIEMRLWHKLSTKQCLAYKNALAEKRRELAPEQAEHLPIWEFYFRVRLLQDYISGMTDLYAYDEYRRLMAAE